MTLTEPKNLNKPNVVVLFGGESGEHQISCATAGGVLRAIDQDKWHTIAVGISPQGQWVPLPNTPEEYGLEGDKGYTVTPGSARVALLPGQPTLIEYQVDEGEVLIPGSVKVVGTIDVVFPLLHGPFGEDGTIQGLLETAKVRYVGCGVASSAVAQDKYLAKTVLAGAGLEVGRWVSFTKKQWTDNREHWQRQIADLGYPVFVKPTRAGSSLGVSKVDSPSGLATALDTAQKHDPRVIVEAGSPGREVECGVLGDGEGNIHVSAVGEVTMVGEEFYDYQSKYFAPDAVRLSIPADLPPEVVEQIQKDSRTAFAALEGEGISRIDFFYEEDTGKLILNEVNTMPGFTPFSMYPELFAEAGVDYQQLVTTLLEEALSRPLGLR